MSDQIKYAVIGAGVVGCSIAYKLSQSFPGDVFVFEKSGKRAENQSSRNSGVIHAGVYYPQSSMPLKARFCVEGNRKLYDFCEEHDVPYKMTGKLVVATNQREDEYLDDVLSVSIANQVPGIERISSQEANQMEPNVNCYSALYVPTSGIVDPTSLTDKLRGLAEKNGAWFSFRSEVTDIKKKGDKFEVTYTVNGEEQKFEAEYLINAAGLYSDEIAKLVDPKSPYEIDPIRGEASKFYCSRRPNIDSKMNVYPAPHGFFMSGENKGKKAEVSFKEFKRLFGEGLVKKTVGVHLTPTFAADSNGNFLKNGNGYVIGNTVTLGPFYATRTKNKEDYVEEHLPEKYHERIRDFFPNLKPEEIELHQTGIQAILKNKKLNDFVIERKGNLVNLVGVSSPGLTSCLAIADYVAEVLK